MKSVENDQKANRIGTLDGDLKASQVHPNQGFNRSNKMTQPIKTSRRCLLNGSKAEEEDRKVGRIFFRQTSHTMVNKSGNRKLSA